MMYLAPKVRALEWLTLIADLDPGTTLEEPGWGPCGRALAHTCRLMNVS